MPTVDDLPHALKDKLGIDEQADLRIINQTLINESYCLSGSHQRFFVKHFLADQSTGCSRTAIFDIQQKLSIYGIAPEPLFLCEESGFYAEQWISPSVKPLTVLEDDIRMSHMAQALAAIHRVPITTDKMDLPAKWRGYIQAGKLQPESVLVKRADELVFLASASINAVDDMVFCHNDLAMNHVINYEQSTIIDWEYCSTGNRYFDIASTIAINQLSATQREALITKYANEFGLSQATVQEGVFRHEPLVTLTYQLWYAAITEHVKNTS